MLHDALEDTTSCKSLSRIKTQHDSSIGQGRKAMISVALDIDRNVLESEMKKHVIDLFTAPTPVRVVPVVAMN
jgi:hypothetical protein